MPSKLILLFILVVGCSMDNNQKGSEEPIETVINDALNFSVEQCLLMATSLKDEKKLLPKTANRFGELETSFAGWWTSGFFPGTLWYLYEYTGNKELKKLAHDYTMRVADQQYVKTTHDLGFIIFCSSGNAFRITCDSSYLGIIQTASNSLCTRFRKVTGCIRSWDYAEWNKQWQYPVIIDNMMNLEMLLWSARKFEKPIFHEIAVAHANTTMKNHFRDNFSSYHVVSYDTLTGQVEKKNTAQGFNDESAWARGQAWGLYGYTVMFRYTQDSAYLEQAKAIAGYILNHPRLPDDKIPYWDFDAPNIPDCYRDASAAAIICSALVELSKYVDPKLARQYLDVAEIQIRTLNSPEYRNALGNNGNFILKHSVGHMPNNTEVDVPLTYADYYFVEALMRFREINGF